MEGVYKAMSQEVTYNYPFSDSKNKWPSRRLPILLMSSLEISVSVPEI
jgi:hypothetical protein